MRFSNGSLSKSLDGMKGFQLVQHQSGIWRCWSGWEKRSVLGMMSRWFSQHSETASLKCWSGYFRQDVIGWVWPNAVSTVDIHWRRHQDFAVDPRWRTLLRHQRISHCSCSSWELDCPSLVPQDGSTWYHGQLQNGSRKVSLGYFEVVEMRWCTVGSVSVGWGCEEGRPEDVKMDFFARWCTVDQRMDWVNPVNLFQELVVSFVEEE